jgi:hypothetical protein
MAVAIARKLLLQPLFTGASREGEGGSAAALPRRKERRTPRPLRPVRRL